MAKKSQEKTPYELAREKNIEENNAILRSLGIEGLLPTSRVQIKKKRAPKAVKPQETRRSNRLSNVPCQFYEFEGSDEDEYQSDEEEHDHRQRKQKPTTKRITRKVQQKNVQRRKSPRNVHCLYYYADNCSDNESDTSNDDIFTHDDGNNDLQGFHVTRFNVLYCDSDVQLLPYDHQLH